jgi:hypothetical protein
VEINLFFHNNINSVIYIMKKTITNFLFSTPKEILDGALLAAKPLYQKDMREFLISKEILCLIPLNPLSNEDVDINLGLVTSVISGMLALDGEPVPWAGNRDAFLYLQYMWVGYVHKWLDANVGRRTASQTAHLAGLLPLVERQLRVLYSTDPVYQIVDCDERGNLLMCAAVAVNKLLKLKCRCVGEGGVSDCAKDCVSLIPSSVYLLCAII